MIVDGISEIAETKTPRIGLLGGTFDPVHNGHMQMCKIAMREFDLDQVWLLISGNPPHKEDSVADAMLRYEMAKLACEEEVGIFPTRYEIDRPGLTYTIDTLTGLKKELPANADLFYIVGMDTLYQTKNWKDYANVIKLTSFICLNRAGHSEIESWVYLLTLTNRERARIVFADEMPDDVSSTDVRYRIAQGLKIDDLVHEKVADFIFENKLYINSTLNYDQALEKLKLTLGEERFQHTLKTVECATKLADKYGVDVIKTKWAALLHDCAKDESFRPLDELYSEYNLEREDIFEFAPATIHAKLGTIIAKKEYNMYDSEILDAIRYHTTGKPNMTSLEKIIFLADCIEPGRDYPGIKEIREKSEVNLDDALLMSLDSNVQNIIHNGGYIDDSSVEARNYLWKETKTIKTTKNKIHKKF